ncbi:nucleoside:proton symporter [Limnothrix sp. PR1529]|uniref:NupC/NupG family nucleoside CNT transporter n=1 Tax=Limnothrix sp. PR1529 TaxID=1704291 RepID=UPI00081E25DA|nr:nucleoside transporter C-terminal domain-containing protein [Limnothrix sp. PR1529]OCQ89172.1 nucleoside:proton symporter [Limnothrix sp. P13C2]PIB15239.1 nucleoside:proton symporter [Limnothrix sp. PR1529]
MSYLNLVSFLGIFGLCGVAWLFSENRKLIPWATLIWGLSLQLVLGFLVFRLPITRDIFDVLNSALNGIFAAAESGAEFIFGSQFVSKDFGENPPLGYIFAVRALPTVVFFSGLMALLYSLGVMQAVVNGFSRLFYRTTRLSGAEALSGVVNVVTGVEALIVVRPFLSRMTRSELCAILACCFGTASSSTLAIYVDFLQPVFSNILGHLISAAIIGIPACFVLSKILVPETQVPLTRDRLSGVMMANLSQNPLNPASPSTPEHYPLNPFNAAESSLGDRTLADRTLADRDMAGGAIEPDSSPWAIAMAGALEGLRICGWIVAALVLIVGLVSLVDRFFVALGLVPGPIGDLFRVVTLANLEGICFFPLTLLTGVAWDDAWESAVVIGRRLLETAIPPYQTLAELRRNDAISDRTLLIVSYALSSFAHLPALGIFVGGLSALIPQRRRELLNLGWRALFVGTLASLMIACVAGFYDDGSPHILGTPMPPTKLAPATPTLVKPSPPPATPAPAPR